MKFSAKSAKQRHRYDGGKPPRPLLRCTRFHRFYKLMLTAAFALLAMAALYIDSLNTRIQAQDIVRQHLSEVTARLESNVKGNVQTVKALIAAISYIPDLDQRAFSDYAAPLFDDEVQLRSIGVIRDYVLLYVHPLKGNEGAIGLNFRQQPDQLADLKRSLDTMTPMLVGPVNLVQGGRGLIARIPVRNRDVLAGDNPEPWGSLSAVIDIDRLLLASGIHHDAPLNIAIRKADPITGEHILVYGDERLFSASAGALKSSVGLMYSSGWELAALPRHGWQSVAINNRLFRTALIAASLLLFSAMIVMAGLMKRRQESNVLLHNMFELSPMGILLTNKASGEISTFNGAVLDELGCNADELADRHLSYFLPTSALDILDEGQYTNGQFGPLETTLRNAQGQEIPVLTSSVIIKDHRGQDYIWSLFENISARKQAETAISRQKEILSSMSEQASIGAWELDITHGELTWSEMTREIYGVGPDYQPTPKLADEFYADDESRQLARSMVARCIAEQRDFSGELRINRANGETLWVKITGRGEFKDDSCVRVYGSFQNINTQKLTELELIRARDAAEQAAVSKSEFLATMSHEIRTPMNGIMGMLSLLGNSELNYEQSKRVHIAKTSAQTLLSLIDDILDFSRIDAGKLETESIRFPLHQLFEDVAESMSLRAQEKGLELVLDLSEVEPEYVIGDPARIRQILNNLTGNAIKFTEYGEVVIRAAVRETSNGLALSCAVRDTGIGIPLNKQGLLFCAFTQVDASTTRKYGGSGLGLSICHKLCTLMGGEIKLSSNAGDGSTFSFYLPLKAASSDQRHSRAAAGRTILVVDDNQSSREAIARQYSHWGATVHTAASAEAALALVEQRDTCLARCDLCLIDRNLPGLDGTELVQFLRQAPQLSDVPMVLMCNINSHGTNDHFRELGFDAWYPKPVTRSAMADFLQLERTTDTDHQRGICNSLEDTNKRDHSALRGQRVLLVEDNPVNQEVVRCLLQELGIAVHVAENGKVALDYLAQNHFDEHCHYMAILMDCQMPEMDGYACTRHIRDGSAGRAARNIPIIALTANALESDRTACLNAGMNDYLSKPIDPQRLSDKIMEWLPADALPALGAPRAATAIPSPQKAGSAIWNEAAALEAVMGQQKTLNKMLGLFVDLSREQLSKLDAAVSARDLKAIGDLAHTLKGSSGQLQATALREAAVALEATAREGNTADIDKHHEQVKSTCEALTRLFNDYLEDHAAQRQALA